MSELTTRRYVNAITKYGVAKDLAKEIVSVSMEMSKGKNIEQYINYAVDLQYGYGFSERIVF